jgi:hypothetical protein
MLHVPDSTTFFQFLPFLLTDSRSLIRSITIALTHSCDSYCPLLQGAKSLRASPDSHQEDVRELLIAACVLAPLKERSLGSLIVVSILSPSDIFGRLACGSIVMFIVNECSRAPIINRFNTQSSSQFKALRCDGIIGGDVIPSALVIKKK